MKDDRFTLGEPFEDILKNKYRYLNVVILKKAEIEFFFDKMSETFSDVDIFHFNEVETISDKDLQQAAIEINYYVSAFYSAGMGFFDSLAIFHTKNREQVYNEIYFNRWLDYQIRKNPDDYLKYLEEQNEDWIKEFRQDRNKFIHYCPPFMSMRELQRVDVRNGIFKIDTFRTEFGKEPDEIIPHCEKIISNLKNLVKEVDKPENIEREYEFKNR